MNIEKEINETKVLAEGCGVLILKKAIDINGEKVSSLKYNFDAMTARDKQKVGFAFKRAGGGVSLQELDSDYHLYLFAAAVTKENKSIDINDILRISARDAAKAEALVRDFFLHEFGELVPEEFIDGVIIQLVFNHFATRNECLDMSLIELMSFYEQLADEAERVGEEMKKENGQ